MNMLGENIDVQVEVEENGLVLKLPRRLDDLAVPWQQAQQLGMVIEQAAEEIPNKPTIIDGLRVEQESGQIKLSKHQDRLVVFLFDHTDHVKLGYHAAKAVGAAIKKTAQDLEYLGKKKIRFVYGKDGMLKCIHNHITGVTQRIR